MTSDTAYSALTGRRRDPDANYVERGKVARQVETMMVRPNFFAVIGIPPLEGSVAPSPDLGVAATSAVISEGMRAELFQDESPIGGTIFLAGRPFRVIGVISRQPLSDTDVWVFPRPDMPVPPMIARLRPGVSPQDAERELKVLASRVALAEGTPAAAARFAVTSFKRQFQVQRFHWALIGAGLAVLLIACTNLANLQLARGIGRAGEIALRSAIGASRPQIVSQLMVESAVLAAGALALGLLLAIAGNAAIEATIPSQIGGYIVAPQQSWRMIAFACAMAVTSLMIVGLVPAIHVSRVDLNTLLKNRAGTGAHRKNHRIYGTLVIVQIALTMPVLCAAVLLGRSALRGASPDYRMREQFGFDTKPLIVARLLVDIAPDSALSMAGVASALLARTRGIDNVASAAVSFRRKVPGYYVAVDDNDGSLRQVQATQFTYLVVTPSYFPTMGLPIERGADFSEGAHSDGSIIMDRSSAWYLWPRSSPIGRSMKLAEANRPEPWVKVQGVVGDHLSESARDFRRVMDTLRLNTVFRLVTSADSIPPSERIASIQLTVRATGEPQRAASAIRRAFADFSTRPPDVKLFDESQGIPQRVAALKFIAALFATFGALALGLSALGVYGIVAQSAADRRREVAVRISLGATPVNIVYSLIRQGNVLVLAGVAIGLYASKETIGWLGSFLGEVDLSNALLFGALCLALFSTMVISALVPAFRATRADPMAVLRSE